MLLKDREVKDSEQKKVEIMSFDFGDSTSELWCPDWAVISTSV